MGNEELRLGSSDNLFALKDNKVAGRTAQQRGASPSIFSSVYIYRSVSCQLRRRRRRLVIDVFQAERLLRLPSLYLTVD